MEDISDELLGAEKVISSIYLANTMDKATYLSAAAVVVLLAMSVTYLPLHNNNHNNHAQMVRPLQHQLK
jgi:hypothetical protein